MIKFTNCNKIKHMKYFLSLFTCLVFGLSATCQNEKPDYQKVLADSLGADDYGMKAYFLVILKTGTNKTEDKKLLDSLFRGHMNNIGRLAANGQLVVAGPLGKNDKTYRGIFILNVKTMEEASTLMETDPAIKEKIFAVEIFKWYGSAALPMYLPYHQKIEKKKI